MIILRFHRSLMPCGVSELAQNDNKIENGKKSGKTLAVTPYFTKWPSYRFSVLRASEGLRSSNYYARIKIQTAYLHINDI